MTTVTHGWRKSSRSASTNSCIELTHAGLLRDSKNPTGPALSTDLSSMLAAIKAGHLHR